MSEERRQEPRRALDRDVQATLTWFQRGTIAVALTLSLTLAGIVWGQLTGRVDNVTGRVQALEQSRTDEARELARLGTGVDATSRRLENVERWMERVDTKLDQRLPPPAKP